MYEIDKEKIYEVSQYFHSGCVEIKDARLKVVESGLVAGIDSYGNEFIMTGGAIFITDRVSIDKRGKSPF